MDSQWIEYIRSLITINSANYHLTLDPTFNQRAIEEVPQPSAPLAVHDQHSSLYPSPLKVLENLFEID